MKITKVNAYAIKMKPVEPGDTTNLDHYGDYFIAALCDAYNLPIAPHVGGGGILSVAASVQYSAAIPNFQILEHSHHAHANKARITAKYPAPVDGAFVLDDTPGLGVEVDEAAVESFALS